MTKNKSDIYTTVTKRIVEQLEEGVRPWVQPWNAEHAAGRITRPLRSNGKAYQGINILLLWDSADSRGFSCPIWMTFTQAKQLGGAVRKGERGSKVVYASSFQKTEMDESGNELEREIPILKQYTVFNVDQCDGLPEHFYATAKPQVSDIKRVEPAARFCQNTNARIREGGNRACYVSSEDFIRMPRIEAFCDAQSHAATLLHELTHWTKHSSRLARDLGRKRWGDKGYAMEELVAELGAAFLCADLGITPKVREDHASYIESWLTVLKNDKRAIFTAASLASKAVEYLHQLQPRQLS